MPEEGVELTPESKIITRDHVYPSYCQMFLGQEDCRDVY